MRRLLMLSGLFLTVAVSTVAWADSPQVNALRQQITLLRGQEKAAITHIRAHYKAIIGFDKIDARGREHLRKNLIAGERQALVLAKNEKEKEKIRGHYRHLFRVLEGKIRLDAGAIRKLREQETHHIRHVEGLYHFKIMEVEKSIRLAEKGTHGGPPRRK